MKFKVLVNHFCTLNLSSLCLRVEKKIFKDIMYTCIFTATPLHKNPYPRGHEISSFGRPFLSHHNYALSLSVLFLGSAGFQAILVTLHGNNEADKAAKFRTRLRNCKVKISTTYLKHFIKLYINSLWQIFCDFCDTSKLYFIQNKDNISYNFNLKRSDQVIISRTRIGYCKLTHTFWKGNNNLSAYFVIVLWPYIIYFWSVPTPFPRGTCFLITYSLSKTF